MPQDWPRSVDNLKLAKERVQFQPLWCGFGSSSVDLEIDSFWYTYMLYTAFKYILKEILQLSYKRCITAVFCTLKDALVSRMANRTFGTLSGDHHLSCWLCRSQNITYIDTQSVLNIQYP